MKRNMMVVSLCLIVSATVTVMIKGTMAMFAGMLSRSGFCVCFLSYFCPRAGLLKGRLIFDNKQKTDHDMLMTGTVVIIAGLVLSNFV